MIFFAAPIFYITAIYVLAAIVPAGFLMRYIYRQDKVEKEPTPLLGALVLGGVLAALAAVVAAGHPEHRAQAVSVEHVVHGDVMIIHVDASSTCVSALTCFFFRRFPPSSRR